MIWLEILLVLLASMLLVPALVLFFQVVLAIFPQKPAPFDSGKAGRIAILIPAHNESSGIIPTLKALAAQLRAGDRLLVVADNCTDDTAAIAATHGAEVITRTNAQQRGKGFALDYGIQHLTADPPDILVIVDADCLMGEGALERLAACSAHYDMPVQALYLMLSPTDNPSLKMRVAEFAWRVKNWVRPLGYARLGLPCQLMGTGMAFPWQAIKNSNLANGNIVEDMKLGIDLALAGQPPVFYQEVLVTSTFPTSSDTQAGQRARWEHGHMATILTESPKLLYQGVVSLRGKLIAMALDLAIPPLALLAVMLIAGVTAGALIAWSGVSMLPVLITLLALVLTSLAIGLAWWGWGRQVISFTQLAFIPAYMLAKIPHYFKFLFKRQKSWNRTNRD